MITPFLRRDRERWLDLIGHAIRLSNPKVTDLGPLKKAARLATTATFPEMAQIDQGGAFIILHRAALNLTQTSRLDRITTTEKAWPCLEILTGTDIGPKSRDGLRIEALRNFETFRKVLSGLCNTSNSDAA